MRFVKIHKAFTCAFCRIPASRFARCALVISTKYAGGGHGAVGYADRSASCVSPSYALLPFLPPKRRVEGAAAVSPDLCREAAANHRAEIHRSAFAIRAACESGAFPPRLWAVIRRSFSQREAPVRRRFATPFNTRLSEKIGCGDISPHPWGTNG